MTARSAKPASGSRTPPRILTPQEFDRAIKTNAAGAYFFYGDEDYLARAYAAKLRERVLDGADAAADAFNYVVLDSDTYSPQTLSDEIQTLPVLTDRRLIEVRGVDFLKADAVDGLCAALEILPDYEFSVVLITATSGRFDGGETKRPTEALYKLDKVAALIHFAPETPARLAQWAARHFASDGVTATPEVCAELVAFVGRDMNTLAGETCKLAAYVLSHGRVTVSSDDIRTVCRATVELDSFALANAVLSGDADGAMQALNNALSRRERPEVLLASISRVFCDLYTVRLCADAGMTKRDIAAMLKMHEYKTGLYMSACRSHTSRSLAAAVESCRTADLKLKGTPIDGEIILSRLALSKI